MLIVGVPLQTMRVPDTTGGLRQVRQPRQQDRRASELERAADGRKPDRQGVVMILEIAGLTISGINLAVNLGSALRREIARRVA